MLIKGNTSNILEYSFKNSRSTIMKISVVLVLVVVIAVCHAAPKPNKFKLPVGRCARDDPELNKCATESIQQLFNVYAELGFPELSLQPNTDPYFLSEVTVDYVTAENKGKMTIINSTTTGGKQMKFHSIKLNFGPNGDKFEMEADIELPKVFTEGKYESKGVFIFPIKGGGHFNVTMTDVRGIAKITGTPYMKKGVEYLNIEHSLFTPKIGNMVSYASNLYTGNKDLNKAALQFINQNWRSLYEEMQPYMAEATDLLMSREGNRIMSKIPLEEMFPKTLTKVTEVTAEQL